MTLSAAAASATASPAATTPAAHLAPPSSPVLTPASPSIVKLWGGIPEENLQRLVDRAIIEGLAETERQNAIKALGNAILNVEQNRQILAQDYKKTLQNQLDTAVSLAGTNQACIGAIQAYAKTAQNMQAITQAVLTQRADIVQDLIDSAILLTADATLPKCLAIIRKLGKIAKEIVEARDTLVRQKEADISGQQVSPALSSPSKSVGELLTPDMEQKMRRAFLATTIFRELDRFTLLPSVREEFDKLISCPMTQPDLENELIALQTKWQQNLAECPREIAKASGSTKKLIGRSAAAMCFNNESVGAEWQIENWLMPLSSLRLLLFQAVRLSQETITAANMATLQARAGTLKDSFTQQTKTIDTLSSTPPVPDMSLFYTVVADSIHSPTGTTTVSSYFEPLKPKEINAPLIERSKQVRLMATAMRIELVEKLTHIQESLYNFQLQQDAETVHARSNDLQVKVILIKKPGKLLDAEVTILKNRLYSEFEKEYATLLDLRKSINERRKQLPTHTPTKEQRAAFDKQWTEVEKQLRDGGGYWLNVLINALDAKEFKPETESALKGTFAGILQYHTRYTKKWFDQNAYPNPASFTSAPPANSP
jgi:hypothetical protein